MLPVAKVWRREGSCSRGYQWGLDPLTLHLPVPAESRGMQAPEESRKGGGGKGGENSLPRDENFREEDQAIAWSSSHELGKRSLSELSP